MFSFSERQNHARDIIKSYDFSSIDGIVVSSGDGLLFEVRLGGCYCGPLGAVIYTPE